MAGLTGGTGTISKTHVIIIVLSLVVAGYFTALFVADNLGGDYVYSTVEGGVKVEKLNLFSALMTFLSIFGAVCISAGIAAFIVKRIWR